MPKISIRKAGTSRGQNHYSVECLGCPDNFGRAAILAIGHLSKDGARALADSHILNRH